MDHLNEIAFIMREYYNNRGQFLEKYASKILELIPIKNQPIRIPFITTKDLPEGKPYNLFYTNDDYEVILSNITNTRIVPNSWGDMELLITYGKNNLSQRIPLESDQKTLKGETNTKYFVELT